MEVDPNHINLVPFSFREFRTAEDKEKVFEEKVKQLKGILGHRYVNINNVPEEYYQKVLKKLIKVELTAEEERKIVFLFNECGLKKDSDEILVSRNIYHYDPKIEGGDERLNKTLAFIENKKIWEKIKPKIEGLSPHHHEEIITRFIEIDKQKNAPLNDFFDQMLRDIGLWNDAEGTQKVIEKLKDFETKYRKTRKDQYTKMEWEIVYDLIRSKSSFISVEQMGELFLVYLGGREQTYITDEFKLKNSVLFNISCKSDKHYLFFENIKNAFEKKVFRFVEPKQIIEFCAWLELTPEEETLLFTLLPDKEFKEIFLVNRVKVYAQNHQEMGSWSFDSFMVFFKFICLKCYNQEIEYSTFFKCIESLTAILNDARNTQLAEIVAKDVSYMEIHYQRGVARAHCNELKNLYNLEKDTKKQLKVVQEKLNALAKAYSSPSRFLHWTYWRDLLFYIRELELPEELYHPILEIFKIKKEPHGTTGRLTSTISRIASSYYYGVEETKRIAPVWKGEKYDTFFNAILEWKEVNKEWIKVNTGEAIDNPKIFIQKVKGLFKFIKNLEFQKDISSLSKEDIKLYNEKQSKAYSTWMQMLRGSLTDTEFTHAFERFTDDGADYSSGCTKILKNLCDVRFTLMNGVSFIVRLMRKLIPLGLEELAKNKRDVSYLAELELHLKRILNLSLDLQHEAIEGLPEEFKIPYLHMLGHQVSSVTNLNWDPHLQGNLPYPFLDLTYTNARGQEGHVKFIRIATPTGPSGITPEFKVFTSSECGDSTSRFLFITLQSSSDVSESTRIDELLKKRTNVKVVAFPVNDIFYMQENEFANPSLYEDFKSAVIKKFIAFNKGQMEVNKPGNYIMRASTLADGKVISAMGSCMDEVKKIFFPKTTLLDDSEKRVLIKFFNIRFAFFMICYTRATTFGFLCNHSADRTGVYNALTMKLLTILFQNEDLDAFGENEDAFTWKEMWKALVNGVPLVTVKRAMNGRYDELTEALTFLDNLEVQQRLIENKEIFRIKKMDFPDFKIPLLGDL